MSQSDFFAQEHCLMEMLRKLAVGAFKATNRLRNMDGQFWVVGTYANTAEE